MVNKCKYCGGPLREGQNFCLACGMMQHAEPIGTGTGKRGRRRAFALPATACLLAALLLTAVLLRWPAALLRDPAGTPGEETQQAGQSPTQPEPTDAPAEPTEPTEPTDAPAEPNGTDPAAPQEPGTDPAEPGEGDDPAPDDGTEPTEPTEPAPEDGQTEQGTAPEPTVEPAVEPTPEPAPDPAVPQPTVTANPAQQAVILNETARFSVKAEGSNLQYQWQYSLANEEKTNLAEWPWKNIPAGTEGYGGINGPELTVKATKERNGYFYRCAVTNGGGTAYSGNANLYSCDKKLGGGLYWTMNEKGIHFRQIAVAGSGPIPDYGEEDWPVWTDNYVTRVVIGSGVTRVGSYAFAHLEYLSEIYMPDTLTSIGDHAFTFGFQVPIYSTVTIPAGVKSIGTGAFSDCECLCAVRVMGGNSVYSSVDGAVYNRSKTELLFVPEGYAGELKVPDSVKTIAPGACRGCAHINSVTLPEGLTTIGEEAFKGCGELTEITIPAGVKEIPAEAFSECTRLEEATIPDSVTAIGPWAFSCRWLSTVHMGSGVKTIGENAFGGCVCLANVYYNGTQEGWDAIDMKDGNQPLLDADRHVKD